ncbi:MAG: bifunctional oligoribonuclease/PAP phosphatase NrnA [Anaerolineales bacterium]|nr:bifunctional oligoribonuclease/PAP phosphatase NrnA [Anaerolineales bacterium]
MAKSDDNIAERKDNNPEKTSNNDLYKELIEVLESHRGEKHVIVLQNYPDPDAIASSYAQRLISKEFNIETDVVYSGKISHQENIAMVRLLGIELHHFDETIDLSQYQGAVFVDNQGTACEEIVTALNHAGIPPIVIVDHHEPQERLNPVFKDIRSKVGATSTIYAQYLEHGQPPLNKSQKEHVQVATALFHGILTDTSGFIRAGAQDFSALRFLSDFRDAEMLEQIMSQARSKQTMEVIRAALGERVVAENYSIAGIGFIRADDRDAIPQAADFLLTEENVHTAIVYGIVSSDSSEERVIGSMRTSKLTLDPDQFIKDVFGKNTGGQFFGGGRPSAGGFEIPVGFLSGGQMEEFQEIKWQAFDQQIKQKIFSKIGVDNPPTDT